MIKVFIIFGATFLALSNSNIFQQKNVVDSAEEQLERLKSLLQDAIFVAHNDVDNLITEFRTNLLIAAKRGEAEIEKQYNMSITKHFNHIVNLRHVASYNDTLCTDTYKKTLNNLRGRYKEQITTCLLTTDVEVFRTAEGAKYLANITMNIVHDLKNQLTQCREDVSCISSLITKIELNKIRMPEIIRDKVQVTEGLLTNMRLSLENCINSSIVCYVSESSTILLELGACIGEIMD